MPWKDPIKKKEYAKKYNSQPHVKEKKKLSRRESYLKNWEQERAKGRQYFQKNREWILLPQLQGSVISRRKTTYGNFPM